MTRFRLLLLAISRFYSLFLALLLAPFGVISLEVGILYLTKLFSFYHPSGLQSLECCEVIHHQSFSLH